MQRSERISQGYENVIFDSSITPPQELIREEPPREIMNIPGTPHEKLIALAEMV